MEAIILCFFFSSRRRHTRCGRDWSSDVCSSDLTALGLAGSLALQPGLTHPIHNLEYTDVACSGATINQGILGQYVGVTPLRPSGPGPARTPLPTQIQQVKSWLASVNRANADVVVISIGGND